MRKHIFIRNIFFIFCCTQFFLISALNAQMCKEGSPVSFKRSVSDLKQVPIITMPAFNVRLMIQDDSIRSSIGLKSMRFAKPFEVKIDLKSQGLMEVIRLKSFN